MTAADRTLAGLVVALVVSAPLVRPVWRAIDPGPADYLRACESLRAGYDVDPWGTPWIRTPWNPMGGFSRVKPEDVNAWEVGSAGRDRSIGTADDMPFISWVQRDEHGRLVINTWYDPSPESPAWSYRSSPAVPLTIALIALLTRGLSGRTRRRDGLAGRATVAGALAIVPTGLALLVFAVNGAAMRGVAAHPVGLLSPVWGIVGSVFLLFAAAVFAHRELHHLQKIEAGAPG